nr:solute carrier family 22 member 15-like [Penaeus vannamei]
MSSSLPECSYFVLNSSSGQVEEEPCVEWDFDNSTFSSTVGTEVIFDSDRLVSGVGACDLAVTKFQLACGWEYLRSTYQSIYMFGVTIGAPFNGVLADRYGRKMTVAVGFVAYSALAIGSCWIPNLSALLLSRFLMGAVHPTIQKTGYILEPPAFAPSPSACTPTTYWWVLCTFGLSLSGGDLSSDPFLYMVLTGVVELPAYTLVIPLVARYGRRAPVVAFFFMGAVALLALPFVPTGSGESMTLALMGKMSIASAFQILDFYSSELFPTEVRTRGMSTALVMSRVGSTCSPFITDYLQFGAASVLAGLATLALPETLHVPLPDTPSHTWRSGRSGPAGSCDSLSAIPESLPFTSAKWIRGFHS